MVALGLYGRFGETQERGPSRGVIVHRDADRVFRYCLCVDLRPPQLAASFVIRRTLKDAGQITVGNVREAAYETLLRLRLGRGVVGTSAQHSGIEVA